jgi:glyoxylase-like metal-dependent hydrolase (beta-lactamase superfamily II)
MRQATTLVVAITALGLGLLSGACRQREQSGAKTLDDGNADPFSQPQGETGQALQVKWFAGADNCQGQHDAFQTFQYDPNTVIMRQSLCLPDGFEAPFIYLLFGDDKVLMLDTGSVPPATNQIRQLVDQEIQAYLTSTGKTSLQLVVAHTHGHGDHVSGDSAFKTRPNTTVVGLGPAKVQQFWGFSSMTGDPVQFDLGGRVLDVLPIPGHLTDHIAIYDRNTGVLLTGDSLYPGHLFVQSGQWDVYKASMQRLASFAADKTITYALGAHIEMTSTAKQDIPYGSPVHPLNEHVLEMFKGHLNELSQALQSQTQPTCDTHNDFIIQPQDSDCQ